MPWHEQAANYLQGNGWTQSGVNDKGDATWNDPRGSTDKPKATERVELPARAGTGKSNEVFFQTVGPPIPWVYTTAQAMRIQRERDALVA